MFQDCFAGDNLSGVAAPSRDPLKQRFRACTGISGCVAVCRYLLLARIVKAVAGAAVKLERDVAAKRTAALHKLPAEPGRGLRVGCAVEGKHRGIGPVALCVKMSAQAAARIEYQRSAEAHWVGAALRIHRNGGKRRAAAIRPPLQPDAIGGHIGATAQIGERPIGIERAHRDLVHGVGALIDGVAAEAARIAARPEAIDQHRNVAERGPALTHILWRFDSVEAL